MTWPFAGLGNGTLSVHFVIERRRLFQCARRFDRGDVLIGEIRHGHHTPISAFQPRILLDRQDDHPIPAVAGNRHRLRDRHVLDLAPLPLAAVTRTMSFSYANYR